MTTATIGQTKQSTTYTNRDVEFIRRARVSLMNRHHLDDNQIATAIAGKKGWSEGSVNYQIGVMSKNGAGQNPNNRKAEYIKMGC